MYSALRQCIARCSFKCNRSFSFPPRNLLISYIINILNWDRQCIRKKSPISAQTCSLTRTVFHARCEYPVSQRGRKQTASGLSGWLYQACGGQACQVGVRQVRLIVKQRNTTNSPSSSSSSFPIPSAFLSPQNNHSQQEQEVM